MGKDHLSFLTRCRDISVTGRGLVGINPLVGAVLVRDGKIMCEATYERYGGMHAERAILQSFDGQITDRDVLYVSLEPCCHTGKTPPCTDIIREKGVKTVVYALTDPDRRVSGKGAELLHKQGVHVLGPLDSIRERWHNRGYVSLREQGRPFVLLKRAATLDGSISNEDGSPLKITTHRQDIWSHIHLRSTVDALCVGRETVRTDNPRLTVRHVSGTRAQPWRVILDPSLRISLSAHVVSDEHLHRTIVVYDSHEASNTQSTHEQLCERGVRTIDIPRKGDTFHWASLWKRLTTPSHNFPGITSLLVEGGEQTWKAFRHAGMVDMEVFLSEKDGQNGVQTVSESHADMHTCVMS